MQKSIFALISLGISMAAISSQELPIMGYSGFPVTTVNEMRYIEAKECGLTALMQSFTTAADARRCLDMAQKTGIKLLLSNHIIFQKDGREIAKAVKGHPALMAYYVRDEPSVDDFPMLGEAVRKIQSVDSDTPCIVNWFGRVDKMQKWYHVPTFEEYIDRFLKQVPTPILSFDQYPVLNAGLFPTEVFRPATGDCHLQTNWYHSLETMLDTSKMTGKPYWAFALSCALRHKPGNDYPIPTEGHLRLQQYSNLAYGAQGLWYYNYKKGPVPPAKMFSQGHPIAPDGRRSTVYERMRRVNNEFQDRAFVFLGAKVDKVSHTGKAIPLGTKRLSSKELPSWVRKLETPDGGAVVSQLTNNGKNYLVVVNRSPDKELTLKLDLIKGAKRVRYDGSVVDASLYTNEFWLDPGMAEIFQAP